LMGFGCWHRYRHGNWFRLRLLRFSEVSLLAMTSWLWLWLRLRLRLRLRRRLVALLAPLRCRFGWRGALLVHQRAIPTLNEDGDVANHTGPLTTLSGGLLLLWWW